MTEKKMTKRESFNALLSIPAVAENADLVAFIEHEIVLLDKKNSAERKPTPKQVENEGFKNDILAWMESGKDYSIADITKGVPSLDAAGVKSQRVTALMTQLKDSGAVVRTEVKGKAFYSLA